MPASPQLTFLLFPWGKNCTLLFAVAARLPAFHTCVGENDELLTAQWYKDHGKYIASICPLFFTAPCS
jgi:hypothetical protein